MAIITRQVAAFEDGQCTWSYDYNDATLKLTAFRCVNDTAQGSRGTLTSQSTGDTVSQLVAPFAHWEQAIAAGVATRFSLRVDDRGRLDGLDHNFEYPA